MSRTGIITPYLNLRLLVVARYTRCSMIVSRDSIQETTTDMFPDISDHNSLLIALMGVSLVGLFWWWNRSAKRWIEKREQEAWPTSLDWLLRDTQRKPAKPLKYSEQEFQEMVATALDEVPEEFD